MPTKQPTLTCFAFTLMCENNHEFDGLYSSENNLNWKMEFKNMEKQIQFTSTVFEKETKWVFENLETFHVLISSEYHLGFDNINHWMVKI